MLTDRLDHRRPVIFQESSIASGDELELEVGELEGTADGENNRVLCNINETTLSMTPCR